MKSPARLVRPSARWKSSYLAALREFQSEGLNLEWSWNELERDFNVLLTFLKNVSHGISLPPDDKVPWTQFWLVEGEEYIGRANIRHYLDDDLRKIGGNIGYQIRPTRRGQGFGHLVLQLTLERARDEFGIAPALVTCDRNNGPSRRIIEAAGGVLCCDSAEQELRFWVHSA